MEDIIKVANDVLAKYMNAWIIQDYKTMKENSQITWKLDGHPQQSAEEWLLREYYPRAISSWKIMKYDIENCTIVFNVKVSRVINNDQKRISARVICENDKYTPSRNGKWGVNPISCVRKWSIYNAR